METGAIFKFKPFKFHGIEAGPGNECWLERDDALDYYRKMTACRIMENKTTELFNQKRIRGFCHQYIGQEACVTGAMAIRDENDPVITSFRCHAWALLMGKSYEDVLCELTGHVCGSANGKGGSMHMYEKNFYGGNGIVGDQISLGAGLAFGLKYKERDNVCFTIFGDGAANQGQFFEVCNMTKNWSLPIVFICENNKYAMYTPVDRGSAYNEFYDRVKFLPGIWADGMDVLAVREALRFARDYAASGYGPIIVELATYNYTGYSTDDPGGYRPDSEVEEMRKTNDPIGNFKEKILQSKLVSSQELEKIDTEIAEEVSKAAKVACEDRTLPKEALYTDIYKNSKPQVIRGITSEETITQPYLYTSDIVKKFPKFDQPKQKPDRLPTKAIPIVERKTLKPGNVYKRGFVERSIICVLCLSSSTPVSLRSVKMSFAPSHYCNQPYGAVYYKELPKVARVEPNTEQEVARRENIVCPAGDIVKVQPDVTVQHLKREVEDLRMEVNSLSCKLNAVLCTKSYGFTGPAKSESTRDAHVEDAAPVSVGKSAKKKYEESFYAGFDTDIYYAGSDVNQYSHKRLNDASVKLGSASKTDTCMETYY